MKALVAEIMLASDLTSIPQELFARAIPAVAPVQTISPARLAHP